MATGPGESKRPDSGERGTIYVPAGAPAWITSELVVATLDCWQFYYHEVLTPEDALEILLNTAHLIDLLED